MAALGLSCSIQDIQLQHVGSSSLTRDQTQVPYTGITNSQPLNHQGSPYISLFKNSTLLSYNLYTIKNTHFKSIVLFFLNQVYGSINYIHKITFLIYQFFFFIFIGVQLIHNVMLASGIQISDPITHIHISIPLQTPPCPI